MGFISKHKYALSMNIISYLCDVINALFINNNTLNAIRLQHKHIFSTPVSQSVILAVMSRLDPRMTRLIIMPYTLPNQLQTCNFTLLLK